MDSYLVEQHSYQLGRESQAEEEAEVPDENSWVMLRQQGEIEPLPQEEFILKGRGRTSLEFIARENRPGRRPLPAKCSDGKVYLTNQRIIYLPTRSTETFKSFSTNILSVKDGFMGTPVFGAWYWMATVVPVPNGGIPPEYALVDVKITFHDGGVNTFHDKYVAMKENLRQAREAGASFATMEALPQYEESPGTSFSGTSAPVRDAAATTGTYSNRPAPDEPPPDYEEAQAQAVAQRLDERLQEAARGDSD